MNHELSLSCYLNARRDARVDRGAYEDLEKLVSLFGLMEDSPVEEANPVPPPFTFVGSAPSLLIVEDELDLAEMLQMILVHGGYPDQHIHICTSGEDATVFVEHQAVGIAFVDIKLMNPLALRGAYMSGLHVVRAIREASPGAKVFLISGFGTSEMVRHAILKLGASYYLGKPFRNRDILRLVHWGVEQVLGAQVRDVVLGKKGKGADARATEAEAILVVDDDQALAEGLALTLRELGYQAVTAYNGREAIQTIGRMRFDAVLLDVRMPDLDGLEVLRQIREWQPKLPVFILTGVNDEAIAQEATRLGAQSFLIKPCDIGLLQVSLEYTWAQRQEVGGSTS